MENSGLSLSDIWNTVEETTTSIFTACSNILINYGWFILAGLVILAVYWKKIQKFFDDLYDKREAAKYAAQYHKNPDLARKRLEEVQASRERMQDELNKNAVIYQEKMIERERQKLEEKAALYGESGYKLGDGASSSKTHKSDYNPLMGDTTKRFKPTKRGCPGGGCGRN